MTAPLSLPQRLLMVRWLGDKLKALREGDLLPQATDEMPPGARLPVIFGGELAGWVGMPKPSVTAAVTSEADLLAWVQKHHPDKVQPVEEVAVNEDVLALVEQYMPQAIRRTERVDPQWLSDLLTGLKAGRYVCRGEVITEAPGIRVGASTPVPRVTWEGSAAAAEAIIAKAWRDGEIPADDLLALPAPDGTLRPRYEPKPAPAQSEPAPPFPDDPPGGGLFTDADGHFRSPEAAAAHAVMVQGGFSTPAREARRMLSDCRAAMMRCCGHCPADCPSMMLCTRCGWSPNRTEQWHHEFAEALDDPLPHDGTDRPRVPHPAACHQCERRPQRAYDDAQKVIGWLASRGLSTDGDDEPAEVPQ